MTSTILLVEDNALNAKLITFLLKREGFHILEATHAAQARALLKDKTPDLVLMDIQLPGENGESLLKDIRESGLWEGLKVIALTAFAMSGDRERFLNMGFDDYISKPIDVKSFTDLLRPHLAR